MKPDYSEERIYHWLLSLGVPPRIEDIFHVGEDNEGCFWVISKDVDYADRLAAAVRRAGGTAVSHVLSNDDVTVWAWLNEIAHVFTPNEPPNQLTLF